MLFSIKSENLKLASRSRDYMRKSTIENLKTYQPREQNMQLSFDKRCSFPAQNSAFSLGQTRLMSGKLSRLKSKHTSPWARPLSSYHLEGQIVSGIILKFGRRCFNI